MAQGFRHAVGERLIERHRQADVAEEGIAGHLLTFAWPAGIAIDLEVENYFGIGFLPRPSLRTSLVSDQSFVAHLTDRSAGLFDPKLDA